VSTFCIIRLYVYFWFLCLPKKVLIWILTHLKSIKFILLFLLNIFEPWKFFEFMLGWRFCIIKVSEVRKVYWFFALLFLFIWFGSLSIFTWFTELRKMNGFLSFNNRRFNFLNWVFLISKDTRVGKIIRLSFNLWIGKWWSIYGLSLSFRYISELIKIKTLILIIASDWEFEALVHFLLVYGFVVGFMLSHGFKWIVNLRIFADFCFFDINLFKWSLLADWLKLFDWLWFKIIFWSLFKRIRYLLISSAEIIAGSFKGIIERILSIAFRKTSIHLKI
jgi:hypothetical protein